MAEDEGVELHPWIVWSNEHHAFWRANKRGYTIRIEEAGRYSREEAHLICRHAQPRANSTIHEGTPPEICMPAPEATHPSLPSEGVEELREALEQAQEAFEQIASLAAGAATSHGDPSGGFEMINANAGEAAANLAALSTRSTDHGG